MAEVPTTFIVHVVANGRTFDVVIGLSRSEREIWGYHESVPWMKISDYFSKGTVTQNTTVDGELVIVNWGSLPLVTYDNPWIGIDQKNAIKAPRS